MPFFLSTHTWTLRIVSDMIKYPKLLLFRALTWQNLKIKKRYTKNRDKRKLLQSRWNACACSVMVYPEHALCFNMANRTVAFLCDNFHGTGLTEDVVPTWHKGSNHLGTLAPEAAGDFMVHSWRSSRNTIRTITRVGVDWTRWVVIECTWKTVEFKSRRCSPPRSRCRRKWHWPWYWDGRCWTGSGGGTVCGRKHSCCEGERSPVFRPRGVKRAAFVVVQLKGLIGRIRVCRHGRTTPEIFTPGKHRGREQA